MTEPQIRFDDGAAYERMMGSWSGLAGEIFLDWPAPDPGLRWLDVGCGNGAFTELLVSRCAPAQVQGIDPSEAQLAFARARPSTHMAQFRQGDAMLLPFSDGSFNAAVMALVIFFVPNPARGIAEAARVVGPGGTVAAYAWDLFGGGFPLEPIEAELRALGVTLLELPNPGASRTEALRELWKNAGLDAVETRGIAVQRTFADFEDLWTISSSGSSISPTLAAMTLRDLELLKERVRARLPPDEAGRVICDARANAIKGRVRRQLNK